MPDKIIFYGHETCPMVPPVWGMLKQSKVDFEYINIHKDEEARQRVIEINQGHEGVPLLVFPDGSTLTEPPPHVLREKLTEHGHRVPWLAMVWGYSIQIFIGFFVLLALLTAFGVI